MFLQFGYSIDFRVMKLGENEKKQYKRWLARGELDLIQKSFGEEHYRSSLSYIAKKWEMIVNVTVGQENGRNSMKRAMTELLVTANL